MDIIYIYFIQYPIRENYVLFLKEKISICRYLQTSRGKYFKLNKVFFFHAMSCFVSFSFSDLMLSPSKA